MKSECDLQSRYAALSCAVELMGFDVERLVTAMLAQGDGYWKVLALRSLVVEFSHGRAREVQSNVSPVAEAAAESWFIGVRRCNEKAGELVES